VGNTLLRRALRAVGRGDRSVAEAALADLIDAADVPAPERLTVLQTSIGPVTPDFLWPRLGLYAQVDGREWHLTPEDWQHDLERQNALAVLGLSDIRPSRCCGGEEKSCGGWRLSCGGGKRASSARCRSIGTSGDCRAKSRGTAGRSAVQIRPPGLA